MSKLKKAAATVDIAMPAMELKTPDSIEEIQKMVFGISDEFYQSASQSMSTHAIGLAMQNAVAQQQEQYILRNSIITAAAKSILESNPKDINSFVEQLLPDDIVETISGLQKLLDEIESK